MSFCSPRFWASWYRRRWERRDGPFTRWEDAGAPATYLFKKLRDERSGYNLLVRDNYFVEKLIPMMSGRRLSEQEMDYYRAPYRRESAWPWRPGSTA